MALNKKVVVSGISLILVVGAVIGAVVAIVHYNKKPKGESLTAQQKMVTQICNYTDFQPECQRSLGPVAQNNSADYKDYVKAALLSISEEAKKALNMSESLLVEARNGTSSKKSLEECKEMLKEAVAELQAVFSYVGDADLHTMEDRVMELKVWIGSVISYSTTCLDIIGDDDNKIFEALKDPIGNASAITDNALAIVGEIGSILGLFGMKINDKALRNLGTQRRLLEDELSSDGRSPSWFSASDRKLMALQDNGKLRPHAVVAKDGSGKYSSINAALKAYPYGQQGRYIIYVKAGVYREYVTVDKKMTNVYMYGDGPRATLVTGQKSEAGTGDKISTSGTFQVFGAGFIGRSMGFSNTAGPEGRPAVALRTVGDQIAFFNCRISGYQDTLYMQAGRQFFRNCVISGHVDYIFGDARAFIQNSLIIVRKSSIPEQNQVFITAPGRQYSHEIGAIIIHNSRIVPEQKLLPTRFQVRTYLGRPWKPYARVVFMESTLADFIRPEGYSAWDGKAGNTEHAFFGEYKNRGPGANLAKRAKWSGGFYGEMDRATAEKFTAGPALLADRWLKLANIPYIPSFIHADS
ncbi:PREDICTED: pectinesterase [Prunus dulcis]|uniref:pectinesterase n=1 Tax=Prunus dulcis TaxID=3755 RepID=A0A5E4EZA1_PRUDU|nr:pectinesterase-like [Prunus dulcis]VVA21117.1 PREDICTED: pectinesterase [Prunus dulcis]